jgi:hypothetical protein
MPATWPRVGTPPSISAIDAAHTDPIEVEPFEASTSETSRIA